MADSVGTKLRTFRKAKKMTQDELAALIGVKRATISNYEIDRRQPSLSDLKRFAEFFGVGLDYFGICRSILFQIFFRESSLLFPFWFFGLFLALCCYHYSMIYRKCQSAE